ncbi:hypothetical protein DFX54_09845 [Escherichia coli]|nr:hypothetical protein [Escherichia coli]
MSIRENDDGTYAITAVQHVPEKKYRVLLNRVDTSTAQDIEWPALP